MAHNPEAELKRIDITVEKPNGMKLVGLLHERYTPGIVVMCHGFRSSKVTQSCPPYCSFWSTENITIVAVAHALEKENFSVFRFDFSGNEDSDGEFNYSNYWGEADDLRAVVQYFTERGRQISAILGHSKGANVVLLYASKYHDVPAVVNLSARFNLDRGMEERFGVSFMETLIRDGHIDVKKKKNGKVDYRVTLQSVVDRLGINMEESCSQIHRDCRVITIHGGEDEITPVGDATLFDNIIPNHTKQIIQGANHCYTFHKDELVSAVLSFLRDC